MTENSPSRLPELSEKQFQQQVIDLAKTLGYSVYHTHDSRRSQPGFPDLVLARRGRLIFAELKTRVGRVSAAQQQWLDELSLCRNALVFVWRPADLPTIARVLTAIT